MVIAVITFGVRGKDRDWMPRWQQNWYGWSFILAVVSCFLQVIVGKILNLTIIIINFRKFSLKIIKIKRFDLVI